MTQLAEADEVYAQSPSSDAAEGASITQATALLSLPVTVAISVGKARLTIEQLLALDAGSILTVDSKIDDPVELVIGERLVAHGRLVEIDGGAFGVEILDLVEGD